MRVLTVGAKPTINTALAQLPDCELIALERKPTESQSAEAQSAESQSAESHPAASEYVALPYELGSKLSLRSIRQVRSAVREHQPDLIHAFYPRPLAHTVLATVGLRPRVPIVSYRGVTSVPKRWSPDEWISYLSPRVAGHACESAAVRDALVLAGIASHKCHVVHNCLTRPLGLRGRSAARQELGLPPTATVAMMVANMRPVKGADLLLEATASCQDLPNLHLALLGRVMDPRIESLACDPRLSGRVHLLGFRQQASQWLDAADLFVMPSRAEALSVALLEAMAAGICPLVSDAGGMKEAVRHEVDGFVFPSEDTQALASALRSLHDSPELREQYAASAHQRAQSYFSANDLAQRMIAAYRSVLGGFSGTDQR